MNARIIFIVAAFLFASSACSSEDVDEADVNDLGDAGAEEDVTTDTSGPTADTEPSDTEPSDTGPSDTELEDTGEDASDVQQDVQGDADTGSGDECSEYGAGECSDDMFCDVQTQTCLPDDCPEGQKSRIVDGEVGCYDQCDDDGDCPAMEHCPADEGVCAPGEPQLPEPLIDENFSEYSSVDEFLDTLNHEGWARNRQWMDFESNGFGDSEQALRYTWPDTSGDADAHCSNSTIGFDHDIRPITELEDRREVWDEYWYKFSENWTTVPDPELDCGGNPDYKQVFGLVFTMSEVDESQDRYSVLNGNSFNPRWTGSTPRSEGERYTFNKNSSDITWDGNWHALRRHMRNSSAPGEPDGRYRVWLSIDGGPWELIADSGPVVINRSEIWGVSLGRNRNHGAKEEMSTTFGRYRVWVDDPGWGPDELDESCGESSSEDCF